MNRNEAQCFRILGLSGTEDLDQVRSAYRRIAFRLHPDRRGGDEAAFAEITAAYNRLVDYLSAHQRVGHSSDRGTDRPRRASKGSRRSSTRASSTPWGAWVPGGEEQQDNDAGEQPDWSSFERIYRERQARKEARRRNRDTSSRGRQSKSAPDESAPQDEAKTRPEQRESGERVQTKRPSRKRPEPKVDDDLASAWNAWCDGAKRFHSSKDGCEDRVDVGVQQDLDGSQGGRDREALEERPSLWRRLFRRAASRRAQQANHQGDDIHLRLPVRTDALLFGGQTRIAVHRDVACPVCDGDAVVDCPCAGKQRIKIREEITVEIPPGARSGDQITVSGKGHGGLCGAPDGDLQLSLLPMALPGFRRQGNDLYGACIVSPSVARSGGHVVVELPRGRVKVNVPARTCVGDRFRLRGQGLAAWQGNEIGDAYLTVEVK